MIQNLSIAQCNQHFLDKEHCCYQDPVKKGTSGKAGSNTHTADEMTYLHQTDDDYIVFHYRVITFWQLFAH